MTYAPTGSLALRVALVLVGAAFFHCSSSTTSPTGATASLTGAATVTNGSTAVTFETAQTLASGTALAFSTQPSIPYTLSASITNATAGVLTGDYTGPSSSTATVLNVNGCYPDNDGINGGSYTIDLVVDDTGFYPSGGDDAGMKDVIQTQNDAIVTLTLKNTGTTPHGFEVSCTSVTPSYPNLPAGCPSMACFPASSIVAPIAPGTSVTITFDTPTPDGLLYPFKSSEPNDSTVPGLNGSEGTAWSLM
jgi:hypothetical protein